MGGSASAGPDQARQLLPIQVPAAHCGYPGALPQRQPAPWRRVSERKGNAAGQHRRDGGFREAGGRAAQLPAVPRCRCGGMTRYAVWKHMRRTRPVLNS